MAKADKHYRVRHSFYAYTKEDKERKTYFTRANQHLVTELLTQKQIDEAIEAGSLVEASSVEAGLGTAPNAAELTSTGRPQEV